MEPTMDDLSSDELADRICELSAHISAAQYRWLRLLAAFDRRRAWAAWGCRSCAHWLNWRCGLDLRSAREKVRVGRALDDLPLICEAFSRGEISYSKVRAITRIATPDTEADLLSFARHGTTQHVEKIVRGFRRSLPAEEEGARHDRRYVEWHHDDDGAVVIKAKLAPEEGALVIEALRKVQEEVRSTRRAAAEAEDGSAEPRRDRADALTEIARRELAGGRSGTSTGDRYLVTVHLDASVLAGGDGACHLGDGAALGTRTVRRLTCDASVVTVLEGTAGEILSVGRKTRTIPTAIRRALARRDGGCRFPGCTHTTYVDGHHIKHWADDGETALSNLVSMCSFHHRLLHDGTVALVVEPDGRFTFLRSDGRVIETAAVVVEPDALETDNAELGLRIEAGTPVARWAGERCDYGVAVEGLLRRAGSAEPLVATA